MKGGTTLGWKLRFVKYECGKLSWRVAVDNLPCVISLCCHGEALLEETLEEENLEDANLVEVELNDVKFSLTFVRVRNMIIGAKFVSEFLEKSKLITTLTAWMILPLPAARLLMLTSTRMIIAMTKTDLRRSCTQKPNTYEYLTYLILHQEIRMPVNDRAHTSAWLTQRTITYFENGVQHKNPELGRSFLLKLGRHRSFRRQPINTRGQKKENQVRKVSIVRFVVKLGKLEKMGKEVEDVEEGEISDTASVEEISEADFNKQDVKVNNNNKPNGSDARVWAVHDLYSNVVADSVVSETERSGGSFVQTSSRLLNALPEVFSRPADSEKDDLIRFENFVLLFFSKYKLLVSGKFSFRNSLPSPTREAPSCFPPGKVEVDSEVPFLQMINYQVQLLRVTAMIWLLIQTRRLLGLINSRVDAAGPGSFPVKSSAKSRDPRRRLINSEANAVDNHSVVINNMPKVEYAGSAISRKQKAVEEPFDVTVSKRLKSSLENIEHNSSQVRTIAGTGGWLEDNTGPGTELIEKNNLMDKFAPEPKKTLNTVSSSCSGSVAFNATSIRNEQVPITSSNIASSLPAVLKDIVVNPTMLLGLIFEQQNRLRNAVNKSSDSATNILNPTSSNSATGTDSTVISSQSTSTVKCFNEIAQSLQDDYSGKIRMKPRDPRRILHTNNSVQKSGNIVNELHKAIVSPVSNSQVTGENVNAQKLEGRVDTKLVPTQSGAAPDITRQFTKNLKNIADIMSVSQESSTHSTAAQSFSSASVPLNIDRGEQKSVVSNSQNLQAGTVGSAHEICAPGTSRSQSTWGDVEHLFEGYDEQQKAAIQRERARRIEEQNKMFAARKLCLVLDLDHTLLNSAKFVEVDPVHDEILRKKEEQDREKPHRHLFRFPHMGMWTKLRPGIWNFLEKASKLYELHLYTMGNKLYATEMAKVLDPKGVLFAGRVISRGDDTDSVDGEERAPKSKDLEGVLGMESAVVIIDDSVRVWPHNKLNLIVVERYTYFPCSRRQFGLPGPSLLEIDHDERPEAGTLASSLAVIERIHQNFFASQSLEEVDVRNILASEQRKILAGCRIVFSRVFPVGEANPHLHPLWQTAEQFGAVCTNQIDEQVTHVVANSLGTDKVNWALSTGRFVVHPGWVEASALLYRRANEQDFAIKP
ncbi:RNA polymerase II C-terminal domain phosphatase-like 3 [Vigna angularis]|uniref:protein-serine/threonine phosphatase n=1 Tax=Phaseolus angularis TaxID=3914 RepID=A0A8T0KWY0_PHAAN|nr:RNA polymerase II C-terminal domain phosphatase-like 3 [Vigna angularis]